MAATANAHPTETMYLAVPKSPASDPVSRATASHARDLSPAGLSVQGFIGTAVAQPRRALSVGIAAISLVVIGIALTQNGPAIALHWSPHTQVQRPRDLVVLAGNLRSLRQEVAYVDQLPHSRGDLQKGLRRNERPVHGDAGSLPCIGGSGAVLDFGEARVVHNNLGGLGPSIGRPHALILENVAPNTGLVVNLEITASSQYIPADPKASGLERSVGKISVKNGTFAAFFFEFVDAFTSLPVEIDPFFLSFFDFGIGAGEASINFQRISGYYVANETDVFVDSAEHDTTFSVSRHAHHKADLIDPLGLTDRQKRHAMSIYFQRKSSFSFTYRLPADAQPQDLLFAGPSSLVCPAVQTCSAQTCPDDFAPMIGSAFINCASGRCSEVDLQKCCRRLNACHGTALDFRKASVLHNNLDSRGPTPGEPGLTIKNVFPNSGQKVNVEIFSTSPYYPVDPVQNGLTDSDSRNGVWGQISVASGTSVDLLFRFVEDPSWKTMIMGPFYFTVFGIGEDDSGEWPEKVLAGGYERYFLSAGTEVEVEDDRDDGLTSFNPRPRVIARVLAQSDSGSSTSEDLPDNAFELTESQRKRAVTFLFVNRSSFSLTYIVAPGGHGRNLVFGGPSSLACKNPKPENHIRWMADPKDRNVMVK